MITPLCSIFRQFLKRQGLKFTAERAQVLDAVLAKPGVFEAEQLLTEIRTAGHHASKATIYRTLKLRGHAPLNILVDALKHYVRTGSVPALPDKVTSDG